MVEDPELPFTESCAARKFTKAGRAPPKRQNIFFINIAFGAGIFSRGAFVLCAGPGYFFR